MLSFACFSPHPPILLPNVGSPADRAKVKKTISALESLAPKLAAARPEIIIISSPHPDWGINVPWFFLGKNIDDLKFTIYNLQTPENPIFNDSPIINHKSSIAYPILTTPDSTKQHYQWGQTIASKLKHRHLAWIASGDMSHRLREDGPYGFHPSGPKFDQKFIELLKKKKITEILGLGLDLDFVEGAGECGLRSFCMLLGALEEAKVDWQPEILSYEGPFGVGYLVVNFQFHAK